MMRYLTRLEKEKSFSGFLSDSPSPNHHILHLALGNFHHCEQFYIAVVAATFGPQTVSAALALEARQ